MQNFMGPLQTPQHPSFTSSHHERMTGTKMTVTAGRDLENSMNSSVLEDPEPEALTINPANYDEGMTCHKRSMYDIEHRL